VLAWVADAETYTATRDIERETTASQVLEVYVDYLKAQ